MKKDYIITFLVGLLLAGLVFLATREVFITFTKENPVLGGFVKFMVLASFGDVIAARIKNKQWLLPRGFIYKAIVWGIIGIFIVLIFTVFKAGIEELQAMHILPFEGNVFARAFFISVLMNITFAPTMMAAHRISDTYIENRLDGKIKVIDVVSEIDWKGFVSFTIFKTIPLFWIPAHTITFILPAEYQVIFAAVLGIFLGLFLGLFKSKK